MAKAYESDGCSIRHLRWRGKSGEIDLIVGEGENLVFVEVKKSVDFATAAQRLRPQQMQRIQKAASEYLGTLPSGQDTPSRFDVALLNSTGEIEILKNAFGI